MQQVVVNIEDPGIEHAMSEIALHEGVNLQDVIMQAIRSFIKQKSGAVNRLDPFQHSIQIDDHISEDLSDITPFASVKNSAQFARELRERAWRRGCNG